MASFRCLAGPSTNRLTFFNVQDCQPPEIIFGNFKPISVREDQPGNISIAPIVTNKAGLVMARQGMARLGLFSSEKELP